MGAVIYFHHTHPLLAWYDDIDQWEAARDTGCNTVHVLFRGKLGRLLNNIMEHPAHHLDVRIPLYNLEAAHRVLHEPSQVAQTFSLSLIRDCVALQAVRLRGSSLDGLRRTSDQSVVDAIAASVGRRRALITAITSHARRPDRR